MSVLEYLKNCRESRWLCRLARVTSKESVLVNSSAFTFVHGHLSVQDTYMSCCEAECSLLFEEGSFTLSFGHSVLRIVGLSCICV